MEKLTIANPTGERGQAVIELALTLPLLLLVVLGIFDFGLMLQRYEVVTNAAREGARAAILPSFCPTAPFTACPNAKTRAENYLNVSGLGSTSGVTDRTTCGNSDPTVPNSRCVKVVSSPEVIPGTPSITVQTAVVTVEYDHQHVFLAPIANLFFGGSFSTTRLTAVSTMRIE